MEIIEITTKLKDYTKKEILDLIESMIENKEIDVKVFENYLNNDCLLDKNQENLILKIRNKDYITDEEKKYIQECIHKKNNIKISSVLKNKKSFESLLLSMKIDNHFEKAWKIYPRKVGKQLAKKSYYNLIKDKKVNKIDDLLNFIELKIIKYKEMCEDNNTEEQFILHFSTFCNSKKYL